MSDVVPEVHRTPVWQPIFLVTCLVAIGVILNTPREHMHEFVHWIQRIPERISSTDFSAYIKNFFEHAAERRGIVIDDIVKNVYPVPVLQADNIPLERPTFTRHLPTAPTIAHSLVATPTEVHDPHEGEWHLSQIAHKTSGVPTDTELASLQTFLTQHGVTVSDDTAREYFAHGAYTTHGVRHSLWRSAYRDTQVTDRDGVVLAAFFSTPTV